MGLFEAFFFDSARNFPDFGHVGTYNIKFVGSCFSSAHTVGLLNLVEHVGRY
jgi:hypothetical protein